MLRHNDLLSKIPENKYEEKKEEKKPEPKPEEKKEEAPKKNNSLPINIKKHGCCPKKKNQTAYEEYTKKE